MIADKIANEDADNEGSLFEFDLSAMHVRDILDREPVRGYHFPRSPADWLAHVLINLRRAVTGTDDERGRAVTSMTEMIELCFLRSPAYFAALELYTMEHLGLTLGGRSTWEVVTAGIERSTGKPFTYPGWTQGSQSATVADEASKGHQADQRPDPHAVLVSKLAGLSEDDPRWADLARLVEDASDDWPSRFRAFARALDGIISDEDTPESVHGPLEKAIREMSDWEGTNSPLDILAGLIEKLAPEPEKGGIE